VLDEGPHHAVLMKPAGMTVVSGRGVPRPTLLDLAIERWPGARPVHRLDKPTAGVCIVAKTPYGQQALSDAFRRHLIDKRYLALIEGAPSWDKLDIDARLARIDDPEARKGPMAHQTVDAAGARALTRVRVLARSSSAALVEARPETGRMHQIRCHLAHVGHPIIGDVQYGATTAWPDARALGLVAFAISFPLPQGGRAFVVGDVPDALKQALSDASISGAAVGELAETFKKQAAKAPSKSPAAPPRGARPAHAKPGPRGRRGRSR
jgi:tRNA pseudouridine32 synthase/23S rRNA pseudouridine746 synthase